MLSGLDRSHDRYIVVGHFHADRDQIDIRVLRQLCRIRERQRHPEMPGGRFRRFLPGRTDGDDLKLRKGLQGRDMGDRGKPAVWAYSYNSYLDLVPYGHKTSSLKIGSMLSERLQILCERPPATVTIREFVWFG